jgi:hypothetical protein
MKPRSGVYETYWYFAAERQNIFYQRLGGDYDAYTADPILRQYKFCNAYRAADRVSQFLIRNVIYKNDYKEIDILFRILFFRLLNKNETWQHLEKAVGDISLSTFSPRCYAQALERLRQDGPIYGNAFILCANKAFGFDEKHKNHLALLDYIFHGSDYAQRLLSAVSLEELFTTLRELPLLGNFMAYQMAIDLNYSELFDFSENDFTIAGPGALRGIAKCFEDTAGLVPSEIITWMVERQDEEFARLGLNFQRLWGRPLHAIDCQGLFCETDKYCRVKFPELASNRVRMKAEFKPSSLPIHYFFPPKWKIRFEPVDYPGK